jgi:putative NADPH-quinone reductase
MVGYSQLVLLGHPSTGSCCAALADSYCAGVRDSGDDGERIDITKLSFDPILQHGYAREQIVEPDIADAQDKIQWADYLVFVYPTWWAAPPALL